jgi:hypothetical protein
VHRTWRLPFNVPSWTSCGCSKHASVIIDHLRTTDPPQDDNLKSCDGTLHLQSVQEISSD